MPRPPAEIRFHVYPTDCDLLGHVNHANMLLYFERARWALFEGRLHTDDLAGQPAFPVVRQVTIGYRAQMRPGRDLVVRSGILKVGTTSFTVRQEGRDASTDAVTAEADLVVVAIDHSGKPVPVPDTWMTDLPTWPAPA